MFLIDVRSEKCMTKTDAANVARGILYCFVTSVMLEQGEGCCEEFEEKFQEWFTG